MIADGRSAYWLPSSLIPDRLQILGVAHTKGPTARRGFVLCLFAASVGDSFVLTLTKEKKRDLSVFLSPHCEALYITSSIVK